MEANNPNPPSWIKTANTSWPTKLNTIPVGWGTSPVLEKAEKAKNSASKKL